MAVKAATIPFFTFVGGLNSEGGYFTSPPNTWKEGDNVVPQVDGSIRKRSCIDYEFGATLSALSISEGVVEQQAFVCEEWNAVNGSGNVNFFVVQVGTNLYFYENGGVTLSTRKKAFSVNLGAYKVDANPNVSGTSPISCSTVNGDLVVVSSDTKPIRVVYDEDTDTISVTEIVIQIRDFEGVEDGLAVNENPVALSDEHKYNLLNQGWYDAKITTYGTPYPSNAQSWIHGKDSSDNFTKAQLDKMDFGTTPAPKGRFVLDVFNRDRATASGVSSITTETENYRPSTCAFFAGRAWYSGINSSKLGTWVLFSQILDISGKLGKCYQDADPTSEVVSDLVDSDGGVVPIPDAGTIVAIRAMTNGVVIFASNGVWFIGGGQNQFSASSYEVKKISSFGIISSRTIVSVEDTIFFWTSGGIYVLTSDPISGLLQAQPVTDTTIKTFYNNIPTVGKLYASGKYNQEQKLVYWAYNGNSDQDGRTFRFKKNNILAFDLRLKCFYTFTLNDLGETTPFVLDVLVAAGLYEETASLSVVDSTDNFVIDSSSNTVLALSIDFLGSAKQFKFLSIVPSSGTYELVFADLLTANDAPAKFKDWYSYNGVGTPYDSYILTGYSVAPSDGSKAIQSVYVTTYMKRTETGWDASFNPINESSCTLQARWDFTDSDVSNKWSAGQEVYRHRRVFVPSAYTDPFEDGYPLVITKNKVRGRGKAAQLKFTADNNKDMQLVGWSVVSIGNANV